MRLGILTLSGDYAVEGWNFKIKTRSQHIWALHRLPYLKDLKIEWGLMDRRG